MFTYKEEKQITFEVIGLLVLFTSLFLCLFAIKDNIEPELIINEICLKNESIIYDYFGNYTEYIELFNSSNNDIDLSDYYISDKDKNLRKYQLPSVTINPSGYYVVFLDSSYSGFTLSPGETLYLYNKDLNQVVSHVAIPLTGIDVNTSYSYDMKDGTYRYLSPTPNKNNAETNLVNENLISEIIKIEKPHANIDSGFYNDEIEVCFTNDNNVDIYYTLDSSKPSINSKKYENPIVLKDNSEEKNVFSSIDNISLMQDYIPAYNVNKCIVLRAIAIDENGNISDEMVYNYFFDYDTKEGFNELKTISIITEPDNLFGYEKGIYVKGKVYDEFLNYLETNNSDVNLDIPPNNYPTNYKSDGYQWKRDANVIYFDNDGKLLDNQEVEISIHGGWMRGPSQKSFNLFKKGNQNSELFSVFDSELSSIMLRNGGNTYETRFNDPVNQMIAKPLKNVTCQNYTPVQVFINGEYWGIYNLQDRIDANMLSNRYNIPEEEILVIKTDKVVNGKDSLAEDYLNLMDFIEDNDMSNALNYRMVESKLDIDSYIDFRCFEIYVSRIDGSLNGNNVGIWKTKKVGEGEYQDSKYRYILYDVEECGLIKDVYDDTFLKYLDKDHVFESLMKNDDFKSKFIERFRYIITNVYDYSKIQKIIKNETQLLKNSIIESNKRFIREDYNETDYYEAVYDFDYFFKIRSKVLLDYLDAYLLNE